MLFTTNLHKATYSTKKMCFTKGNDHQTKCSNLVNLLYGYRARSIPKLGNYSEFNLDSVELDRLIINK